MFEECMRKRFNYYNKYITWIIDKSEPAMHSSQNMFIDKRWFSAKKGQHSITLLIIILPTRKILYVGNTLYNSVNDDELVKHTLHEWLHNLNQDVESGFKDLGFRRL